MPAYALEASEYQGIGHSNGLTGPDCRDAQNRLDQGVEPFGSQMPSRQEIVGRSPGYPNQPVTIGAGFEPHASNRR